MDMREKLIKQPIMYSLDDKLIMLNTGIDTILKALLGKNLDEWQDGHLKEISSNVAPDQLLGVAQLTREKYLEEYKKHGAQWSAQQAVKRMIDDIIAVIKPNYQDTDYTDYHYIKGYLMCIFDQSALPDMIFVFNHKAPHALPGTYYTSGCYREDRMDDAGIWHTTCKACQQSIWKTRVVNGGDLDYMDGSIPWAGKKPCRKAGE